MVRAGLECGELRVVDVSIYVNALLGAQNWVGVWYRPEGCLSGNAMADLLLNGVLIDQQ